MFVGWYLGCVLFVACWLLCDDVCLTLDGCNLLVVDCFVVV